MLAIKARNLAAHPELAFFPWFSLDRAGALLAAGDVPGAIKAGFVPLAVSVPKAMSVISGAPAEPGFALPAPPAQGSEHRI